MQNYQMPNAPQSQQGMPYSGQSQGQWFNPPQQPIHYGMPQSPWGRMPGFSQGGNPYLGYGNGIMGYPGYGGVGGGGWQNFGGMGGQPQMGNFGMSPQPAFGFGQGWTGLYR